VLLPSGIVRAEPPAVDCHGDPLPAGAVARLGTVRFRNPNRIIALAYSPDGKVLATADVDFGGHRGLGWPTSFVGSLRLRDAGTGKELRRLADLKKIIRYLAFAPDGKLLLSVGDDGVKFWDPATGKELAAPGGTAPVQCAALSPDGKVFATGAPGLVRLYDREGGNELRQMQVASAQTPSLVFSPDGKALAGPFQIWEVSTGRELLKLPPEARCDVPPAFSPDGKLLVTGSADQPVRLWDTGTGKEIRALGDGGAGKGCVAFSSDGTVVIGAGTDATILWNAATGKELRRFKTARMSHVPAALAPGGSTLALIDNRAVRVYDVATGKELRPAVAHDSDVETVAFSPDGKTAITGGDGLVLWDAATGKEKTTLGERTRVGSAVMTPDGKAVVVGYSESQAIVLWDAATGKELRRFDGKPGAVEYIGFLSKDRSVVSMCQHHVTSTATQTTHTRDLHLHVWDLETGKEARLVANEMMHRATSSPDGRRLAGGMHKIGVWDALSGRELARLDQPGRVFALAFSPDGRRLASSEFARPIRVWEVATNSELVRLAGHDGVTVALAFAPDGRVLASGGSDGRVRLWSLASGKELRKFEAHQGPVLALAFSPDGRRIISGSRDTTALIWDVGAPPPEEPAARLGAEELKALWAALAGPDGAAAMNAICRLARAPEQARAQIRESLGKRPKVDPGRLARLVADLDDDDFEKRDAASEELARIGRLAEEPLKRALAAKPSDELRYRAEALLKKLSRAAPAELQGIRALEVLELDATPDAIKLIEALAKQSEHVRVADEAKATLERLARRKGLR
jgi:WD40 repeat protein